MENDGNRYELVNGELQRMTPSPTAAHQRILVNLSGVFHSAGCMEEGEFLFAPIDVVLGEEVRQPDFLSAVSASRCRSCSGDCVEVACPLAHDGPSA